MWLLILEAAVALALLLFAVWWTMFSGRRGGEPEPLDETGEPDENRAPARDQEVTGRSDASGDPPSR